MWLLLGGASLLRGLCVVAPGGGLHSCSVGGVHGCSGGCMVALGGHAWLLWVVHGCLGGHVWLLPGGHAWLLHGGGAWLLQGGMRDVPGVGGAWDTTRYGDTINERAVRILLEYIFFLSVFYSEFSRIFPVSHAYYCFKLKS